MKNKSVPIFPRHLLSVADLSSDQVAQFLDRAAILKKEASGSSGTPLRGKTLGLIFQKASTRTRISFEVAMTQLGGHSLFLSADELQLGRGEPIADTARVLSGYLDGLVIRTFDQATLEEWAAHAAIPVINGLTDLHHPCQALSDLLTITEALGRLRGVKLAYIGDGNNVAHSLVEAAARTGLSITLACPKGHGPNESILARARRDAKATGAIVELTTDPASAARDSDVLYTDVWTSMGQERQAARRRKLFRAFQLNRSLVKLARPEAIVLHCLPAHRGEEITDEVMDSPRARIFQQAENRLHMQKAILEWLLRRA
ncbi:MAG: ornithine carbamoyltransferase [Nitrospirota bacterium]